MNLIVAGPDVQDPLFTLDLSGRVRNLSLPAASSALVPLFEAVSNSIHAVEARFPDRSVQDGSITITLVRANDNESELQGFVVQDNGTGLTEENMKSFLTSDSPYKQRRGGKGIGRLTWLKTLQNSEITSTFAVDGGLQKRTFTFSLQQSNPISGHVLQPAAPSDSVGTKVTLVPFFPQYAAHCPRKVSTIAAKLVGHFLNYFVTDTLPRIIVIDDEETIDLSTM